MKFILTNMMKMDFSLVEKHKGEVIFSKRVEFYGGTTEPELRRGELYTEDEREIRLLLNHPWYGIDFILDPNYPGNKTKEVVNKEPDLVEEVTPQVDNVEQEYTISDASKIQEAAGVIRKADPSIKVVEVRTKKQILEFAEVLKIKFPNL
jgi:hypothetical protein